MQPDTIQTGGTKFGAFDFPLGAEALAAVLREGGELDAEGEAHALRDPLPLGLRLEPILVSLERHVRQRIRLLRGFSSLLITARVPPAGPNR